MLFYNALQLCLCGSTSYGEGLRPRKSLPIIRVRTTAGRHRERPALPSDTAPEKPMWETCSIDLTVRLPRDIAAQAEEIQKSDPEFLSRLVLYGLTRRSIYRHLQDPPVDGGPARPDSPPLV